METIDHAFNQTFKSCQVKVIYDPQAETSFSMRFGMGAVYKVLVKIIVQNPNQLLEVTNTMKKVYGIGQYNFIVNFNWKGCSKQILSNQQFKNDIRKIFGGNPKDPSKYSNSNSSEESYEDERKSKTPKKLKENDIIKYKEWALTVYNYTVEYGCNPDFNDYKPKTISKLCNYIRSRLGMPLMTDDEAIIIVDEVRKLMNKK